MKGILVQTTLYGERDLKRIIKTKRLRGHGLSQKAIGFQLPLFKDRPLSYCSFFCKGYEEVYGNREGIVFETEASIAYACPVDNFHLLRGGNWLPGHDRFIFPTIEKMLERYPNSEDFKKDFQEYFSSLKPKEVYPNNIDSAELWHRIDYCLRADWNPGCNEVTFDKPTIIRPIGIFRSAEDLRRLLDS